MDFNFTEEQQLLADTVRRFVREHYSFEARREILKSKEGWSRELWQQLAGLGLTALNVPQFLHKTSAGLNGSTFILALQFLQLARRCCRPSRFPHLHCQLPIWYSTYSSVAVSRKSDTGKIEANTDCSPM